MRRAALGPPPAVQDTARTVGAAAGLPWPSVWRLRPRRDAPLPPSSSPTFSSRPVRLPWAQPQAPFSLTFLETLAPHPRPAYTAAPWAPAGLGVHRGGAAGPPGPGRSAGPSLTVGGTGGLPAGPGALAVMSCWARTRRCRPLATPGRPVLAQGERWASGLDITVFPQTGDLAARTHLEEGVWLPQAGGGAKPGPSPDPPSSWAGRLATWQPGRSAGGFRG